MFRKSYFLFLAMAVSICCGATAADADLVTFFNDLGTTYQGSYTPYGWSYPSWGGGFTASGSGSVTEIDLEIAKRFDDGNGYSGAFTVEVWESSANLPSIRIYRSSEQTANAVYPSSTNGYNPMTALQSISVTGLNLTAGQSYFLVVVASQSNSDLVWYMSSDTTGTTVRSNGTWETYSNSAYEPAFKIVGETTPVPIPAAVWLLGSGLIGLIGIRRFRK